MNISFTCCKGMFQGSSMIFSTLPPRRRGRWKKKWKKNGSMSGQTWKKQSSAVRSRYLSRSRWPSCRSFGDRSGNGEGALLPATWIQKPWETERYMSFQSGFGMCLVVQSCAQCTNYLTEWNVKTYTVTIYIMCTCLWIYIECTLCSCSNSLTRRPLQKSGGQE